MDSVSNFTISNIESVPIIKEESSNEVAGYAEVKLSSENRTKDVWLEAPTKLLLYYLEEFTPKIGKTLDLKNKSKMLQRINEKLTEAGYSFTAAQVHGKYRSLERHNQTKLHNLQTEKNRTKSFHNELKEVSSEKTPHPEFVDSEEKLIPNERNMPPTPDGSCSPAIKKPKHPRSAQDKIFKIIDEIGKERAAYHSRIVKLLEHKEGIDKERNELLRTIAYKLNK